MKRSLGILFCVLATIAAADEWKIAEPGWRYEFPRDHHAHNEFKTEWWYFTGNLSDAAGHRFGYQLTFFRQGIRPLAQRDPALSRFVVNDLKFAHFTVTDVDGKRFHFDQKANRGAFGEAGFDEGERLAWIDVWTLTFDERDHFELTAKSNEATIHLRLETERPPVVHGENGISAKAGDEGHASHYYSLTRLKTTGEIVTNGRSNSVSGLSWFDHEWATNQLAPGQVGWNWLSVQFDDGTDLMLYQMRLENGQVDPSSSGTWIAADGTSVHLPNETFRLTPSKFWKSEKTTANYPVSWRVELPDRAADFSVKPLLENQELALLPLAYWEGAIEVTGSREGKPIHGRGYLELTGYAGPLRELQR